MADHHRNRHHHRFPGNLPHIFHGRSSRFYDFFARRVFRRLYRRLAEDVAAAVPDGAFVLDVGTGPGVLLMELARRRPDLTLTGIDLSEDMVGLAARNTEPFGERVSVRPADVTKLPFPDDSFDLIVSSLSLHHWDHPEAAAPELARVLRPGGSIHIYDFRFAPFEALGGGVLIGQTQGPIRTGIPFFPRCVKHVLA